MESSEKYNNKLKSLKKALNSFSDSMKIDLFSFTEIVLDTVKNGQMQKFEICSELFWKTIKLYLNESHGTEANSPKSVYRELFANNLIDEDMCENLIKMVDDRNSLSHIYNDKYFEQVYKNLNGHLEQMQFVINKINK
jgi:nucleotidyltransferase substrate binding protein (TIGR01987 family)